MGVTLVKFLESAETSNRALYYLDNGETDLPFLYQDNSINVGSIAVCPKTGAQWWLNSSRYWARSVLDLENVAHSPHGGSGSGSGLPAEKLIPTVSAIIISPTGGELKAGTQIKLIAEVQGVNLTTEDVIWSIVPTASLHKNTTISEDGILTIAAEQKKSKIKIRALSKDDLATFSEVEYQIVTTGSIEPQVTGLVISPKIIQQVTGSTVRFKAELSGIGDFDKEVHWEIIGATASMIHQDGIVEIPVEEKVNAFLVRAVCGTQSDSATVEIAKSTTNLVPYSVKIKPEAAVLKQGSVFSMVGIVDGPPEINKELIWSIETPVSANTRLSSNGILTVAKDETAPDIKIKAISCQSPDTYAEVVYNIEAELDDGQPEVSFVYFVLNPGKAQRGGTAKVYAVASGRNLTTDGVKYSVEGNTTPSTKISESGILSVATDEKATSVLVAAAAIDDPTKKDYIVVVLKEVGEEEKVDPVTGFVPEVNLVPVNVFYVRGVDANGIPHWKSIDTFKFVEEAPTTKENAIYGRKTVNGKNVWSEIIDGIPTMTRDEWNRLPKESRPPLANIKDYWLQPSWMNVLDPQGYLY